CPDHGLGCRPPDRRAQWPRQPAGRQRGRPGSTAVQRLLAGGRARRHAAAGGDHWGHCDCPPARGEAGMIPLLSYLIVGAILFVLGMIGFLTRRNLILMFLCAEMMLQGVAINLITFARHHGNLHGQVFTLFIITVAACEAALALALILMLYRS